jgi:hypothetical protein
MSNERMNWLFLFWDVYMKRSKKNIPTLGRWSRYGTFGSCNFLSLEGSGSGRRAVLEFQFRASCLLGRHFTTWTTPPALLALVIFEIWSWIYDRAGPWYSVYTSHVAGMTSTPHHAQLFCCLRWYLVNFCSSWPQTKILQISSFQVARIIDVNHCAQLFL